jgi:LPXTG-site transpeptidase (sortase) family protein
VKKNQRIRIYRITNILFGTAGCFFAIGTCILFLTYTPLLYNEVRYSVRTILPTGTIRPIDSDFGIIIPKLAANAHIVANVDPFDSSAYQLALTKGVAHARGTSVPGAMGNVFLFAHSSENFYDALRYNSVFYLLPKLTEGDQILLYYHGVKFTYVVTNKKFVDPKNVSYLESKGDTQTVTLMTCWPPGTTFQRLLVFAKLAL